MPVLLAHCNTWIVEHLDRDTAPRLWSYVDPWAILGLSYGFGMLHFFSGFWGIKKMGLLDMMTTWWI